MLAQGAYITGMQRRSDHSIIFAAVRVVFALALVYFSTIYPYLHFHHDHNEGWSITVSLHPLGAETENSPDHHEDDHHAEARHSAGILPTVRLCSVVAPTDQTESATVSVDSDATRSQPESYYESSESPPPRSDWHLQSSLLRGPPARS